MSKEVFLVPTSFAQQRLWFLDRLEPDSPVFNIPSALRLSGRLDVDVLRRSLEEVVRRHETLRTRLATVDDEPVQVIEPSATVELPLVDLSHLDTDERRERARELADEAARRGFDLTHGPLWRASVLRLEEEEHVLLFTMHHIISDGWSMGVLVREMGLLYEAFARGGVSPLPELPVQYTDYAIWQRKRLEGSELERQLAYWEGRLANLPEALELPTDRPRPAATKHRGGSVAFRLTPEVTSALKAVSRREGATLFMTLLAGFEALLYRHTGQESFAVGTPVAGRGREELRDLIGFFVNTLALRADVDGELSFSELVSRVRSEALGAYAHQEAPFERVVERLRPARVLDRSPIFQVMLALDNTPHEETRLGSLRVAREPVSAGAAKYDLSLLLEERDGGVAGVCLYDADLFDEATVGGLVERYALLLEGAAADPSRRVSQLPLLTREEEQRHLVKWNETTTPFPAGLCVHELFERQARLTPEAVAVVGEDGQFTYAELNARADSLARRLRSHGVRPESRVALLMERGAEMLAALLGVLKAGGAYVPLDPAYPRESLAFMLEDSGAEVLLTRDGTCEVPGGAARVVDVAEVWRAEDEETDAEGFAGGASPDNLAYVIYTSGSTGRPKGVCVSHRSLVNYTLGVTERLGLSGGLSFALVSTPAADLGNTALYPSLCTGGCLHVITRERAADASALAEYFERHTVDCLKIVPSHLSALLAGAGAEKILPRRRLVLGGEASSWGLARKVRALSPDCAVFNHYGPTETTVGVLTYAVGDDAPRDEAGRLPLGRPLPNVRVYVLDKFFNPVPVGVVGELYIGGEGLARGYLNRPAPTAERFVPDPFSTEGGERLYRTGDVARYLANGNVEFLGRADNQVKVRGFRVELGEIEAALRSHPLVQDAAVLAWEERPGEVSLAAYAVAESSAHAVERGELRRFLGDKLPRHMLPAVYTMLDAIPLTPNGKVDRKALPLPGRESPPSVGIFDAACTPTEELLTGMWMELLGVERVGVTDDFFELGGHSLLATRLAARVRERFGVEVALRKVFETPTVRGLAAEVDEALGCGRVGGGRIERRDKEGATALSYAQQRLWFLDRLQPGSPFYNLPGAVRLRGALDVKAFERSLNEVVRRHEILRTTFKTIEGEPVQVVNPILYLPLPVTDLSSLPDEEREAEARRLSEAEAGRPFDLAAGPPLRAQLLRVGEREHVFLLTVHHIVADGWAMGVFVQEVAALYEAFTRELPSPLVELAVQYADFAHWQRRRLADGVLERDLAYWERQLAGAPALLTLPTDRPRPPVQSHRGSTFEFALTPELTGTLKDLSRREGATLFMTLLAGFVVLLQRHAGQDDILVGTPVAGRQQEETERLIGLFINMLVLRSDLSDDPTFRELLRQTRERALEAYAHQEAPFEQVVERLRPARALDRSPIFQVMLALDNTPQEVLRLGDLAAERVPLRGASAKYDLTFSLEEDDAGLRGVVEYRTDLFDEATVRGLAERYKVLLAGAAADPMRRVSQLPLLTEEEQHSQLVEWNRTAAPFPSNSCVHELFAQQVRRTPDAVALVFEGERLTYADLDERAARLAARLQRLGVGTESRVGVLLERSVELVVALLAVLKAGGAYVPLDPEYPAERLAFMAEDAGLSLVLTSGKLAGLAEGWGVRALVVGAEPGEDEGEADGRARGVAASPDNLAYVIYTSGSTGRPKGVCVSHRNVVNLLSAMDEKLGGAEPGVWLAITSVSFDISVLELFWTLTRGFKVVLQGRLDLTADAQRPADASAEKALDFSLFYFASDDNTGGEDIYELLLEGAKFADEHGFSAVWTPERHFHAFGGTYPNPSVTSAAVAAVTKRIEIRAGSVVIPLHDPLRVAEEWAMVDNLSKGRVAISFASGWHANDFVLAPDIYESRHEVMYRNIELVRRLWRGEPVMRRTGAGNEIEVRVHPRPVQPELRFWITAAGNPETFRTAGRLGANLLTHLLGQTVAELGEKIKIYREAWREHGHGPGGGHVTLMLHTFVADDLEEVREVVRAPFSNYLRSSINLLRHSARSLGRDLDSGRVTEVDMEAVLAHAFDRYFGTAALLGTPESCLPMVERLKAADVDEVGCLIDFGVDQKKVLASLPQLTELKERSNRPRRTRGYSLAAQLREHEVTHLQLTPSMARLLLADEETTAALRGVRKLLVGGEALPATLARQLREQLAGEVHNMYGPTETTVWSTTHEVGEVGNAVPIGRPIANTTVRILDRSLRLAPAGVTGEIYIGGEGVARGYLNRPALTAERFIPDPFSTEAGARLYRTGDVARYLADGNVEFLGRADNQVKVRGFRVELGEVEAALRGCPGVRETVVVAREDISGDKRLLAYIVPSAGDGEKPSAAALRSLLHEKLPSHLVPSAFSFLEELPLTPNGKVDRKALPDPTGPGSDVSTIPPRSEAEQTVASIWREVLKLESVGVNDNFFEIGGTSLLVVQVSGRLREAFGRDVPIVEMFRHPTVNTLARFIGGGADERPSFGQAQSRAARHAEAMSEQKRLTQARPARRPPGRPR